MFAPQEPRKEHAELDDHRLILSRLSTETSLIENRLKVTEIVNSIHREKLADKVKTIFGKGVPQELIHEDLRQIYPDHVHCVR